MQLPAVCFAVLFLACASLPAAAQKAPPNPNDIPASRLAPRFLDDRKETAKYLSALPEGVYRIYEVQGLGRFYLDDIDDVIKNYLRSGRAWEYGFVPYMLKHAKPGSTAIDAGAHIGTHSLTLSRAVGPEGRVYAFEPQKKIYRELTWNLKLNRATNVVPLRFALGDKPGVVRMDKAVSGNEGATHIGAGGDRAELRTLDEFSFQNVSFIKIDVETYEGPVLDGARKTIARHRPAILIEIQGGENYETTSPAIRAKIDATRKKLTDMGYRLERLTPWDYLALPER